jgi:hypothetical protein
MTSTTIRRDCPDAQIFGLDPRYLRPADAVRTWGKNDKKLCFVATSFRGNVILWISLLLLHTIVWILMRADPKISDKHVG